MLTFLMIGAHPDDMDLRASGLAMKLVRQGHRAVFLSITNGNAGHMAMDRDALRLRRRQEMADAAEVFGLPYDTLRLSPGSPCLWAAGVRLQLPAGRAAVLPGCARAAQSARDPVHRGSFYGTRPLPRGHRRGL